MYDLYIDLETYSSVDIKKSGLFKYVESPDFEIMLFAYSLNGNPVQVIDLAQGEKLPQWLTAALYDPAYVKHAYNAMFEWRCLSRFLGGLPIEQWRCTMIHGLYCGYPAALGAITKALKLDEDKQKSSIGKSLIRYFCVPCAPTKANGNRTRNLPHHYPDRWELFKEYNAQDVVAEMAVEDKLSAFPVPDFVWREWETDIRINARGVAVDLALVNGAVCIGSDERNALIDEAVEISGVKNPNSIPQIKEWLNKNVDDEVTKLDKDAVAQMLNGDDNGEDVRRMLEIRQGLSKTSTKKYDAIESSVCADGRVRGLLQFYGAGRTGRWAGRLVQVQNLPQTHIEPLALARELVSAKQANALRIVYGNIPDTLSQLIRTCFISPPGKLLVDADFSAIEARVLSWISGEQWRMEVFRSHGKIYEASAAQMFGVPIERINKGNPEYALRQKGKVAELALGYQGGKQALIKMGALEMGLNEDELPEIIERWRGSNKRICDFWQAVNSAAISAVSDGNTASIGGLLLSHEYNSKCETGYLTIRLPSGRKLFYANPLLVKNKWGEPSINYIGSGFGGRSDTYGGKLVENIVQAIARDCLSCTIELLEKEGFEIIMHCHDEVVIECAEAQANLEKVVGIMSQPMPWAPDLPLTADGWVGTYFRKE